MSNSPRIFSLSLRTVSFGSCLPLWAFALSALVACSVEPVEEAPEAVAAPEEQTSTPAVTPEPAALADSASTPVPADPSVPMVEDRPATKPELSRPETVPSLPGTRVVDCDAPVQSRKRGIAANRLSEADFRALAPGVSWYYNWSYAPGGTGTPPAELGIEFIPMVWGGDEGSRNNLKRYLDEGHRPRVVLGINEPNLVEHNVAAAMTPKKAADLYGEIQSITERYDIPLIGPQMSIGSPPHMSVTAYDPIERKKVTYTYMVPFLKAFMHYADERRLEIDGLGMHPYMVAAGLEGLMNQVAEIFDKPIWVTEFSNSEQPLYDIPYKLRDLVQAVDYMERAPHIHGYSYFKERNAAHPPLGLFTDRDGELNELGQAYVNMPVHDPEIFYRLPGRLQAEKYIEMADASIWPTTDADGFLHLRSEKSGALLTYHVYVPESGEYKVSLRVTGAPGQIGLRFGDREPLYLEAAPPKGEWQTLETVTSLDAGSQKFHLRMDAEPFGINWIEVQKSE